MLPADNKSRLDALLASVRAKHHNPRRVWERILERERAGERVDFIASKFAREALAIMSRPREPGDD